MNKLFFTLVLLLTVTGIAAAQSPPISGDADCPYIYAYVKIFY